MRYLLIPVEALEVAKTALALTPGDEPLTAPQEAALSAALAQCVLKAELLVAYAMRLGGRPHAN